MEQENNVDTELRSDEPDELVEDSNIADVDVTDEMKNSGPVLKSPQPEAFNTEDRGIGSKPQGQMPGEITGMDLLMDVNLDMTVELGRAKLSINEVMDLTQGSVIELDKMAGEPVDIRVNGIMLAQGEVIVMDDIFGVRITRLSQRVDHAQILS
jgi:flagellar motor switch protein FliN